ARRGTPRGARLVPSCRSSCCRGCDIPTRCRSPEPSCPPSLAGVLPAVLTPKTASDGGLRFPGRLCRSLRLVGDTVGVVVDVRRPLGDERPAAAERVAGRAELLRFVEGLRAGNPCRRAGVVSAGDD